MMEDYWEVTGGADKGGILVREGKQLTSAQLAERLSTGSIVKQIALDGERLHFAKISGNGPDNGWVSLKLQDKQLLKQVQGADTSATEVTGYHDEKKEASEAIENKVSANIDNQTWLDLDNQVVGPWTAHNEKVTTVLFDRFHIPPGESRRLYTACWNEAKVACWDLSRSSVERKRQLRLVGELSTFGLVSDMAQVSRNALVTSVSANPVDEESLSVCHQADFKQRLAERDDRLAPGDTLLSWDLSHKLFRDPSSMGEHSGPELAQKIPCHNNGCHRLQIWPPPTLGAQQAEFLASISNDNLAVASVTREGLVGKPKFQVPMPHGDTGNARHLAWEHSERLWSCDKKGNVKAWDLSSGGKAALEVALSCRGLSSVSIQSSAGLLLVTYEDGFGFFDVRSAKMLRQQHTKSPLKVAHVPETSDFTVFTGISNVLVQFDTRMLPAGLDTKSTAVGTWELQGAPSAIDSTRTLDGTRIIAVGLDNGKVAAFDTDH